MQPICLEPTIWPFSLFLPGESCHFRESSLEGSEVGLVISVSCTWILFFIYICPGVFRLRCLLRAKSCIFEKSISQNLVEVFWTPVDADFCYVFVTITYAWWFLNALWLLIVIIGWVTFGVWAHWQATTSKRGNSNRILWKVSLIN